MKRTNFQYPYLKKLDKAKINNTVLLRYEMKTNFHFRFPLTWERQIKGNLTEFLFVF